MTDSGRPRLTASSPPGHRVQSPDIDGARRGLGPAQASVASSGPKISCPSARASCWSRMRRGPHGTGRRIPRRSRGWRRSAGIRSTGSPLTGSAASITASQPSISGMPRASIAHIEATVTAPGSRSAAGSGRGRGSSAAHSTSRQRQAPSPARETARRSRRPRSRPPSRPRAAETVRQYPVIGTATLTDDAQHPARDTPTSAIT